MSLAILFVSARRVLREMREAVRRIREIKINMALASDRVEIGMSLEHVRQVLVGWSGRRTHYMIGRRRKQFEIWQFRRDAAEGGAGPPDECIVIPFLDGQAGTSVKLRDGRPVTRDAACAQNSKGNVAADGKGD